MKRVLGFALALLALGGGLAQADNPYVFALIADEDPSSKARVADFIKYMKSTSPFSQMGTQIKFEVLSMPASQMECGNNVKDAPRVVTCNTALLSALGSTVSANRTLTFTSKGKGGSGGSVPVASPDYPLNTMLHELLHSYKLFDEYPYSASEAKVYCTKPISTPNVVGFAPRKAVFNDDADARATHSADIPWYSDIQVSTLITTSNHLGTTSIVLPRLDGKKSEGPVGLYAAGVCDSYVPTWKPLNENTIMKDLTEKKIPILYQRAVVRAMSAERGAPISVAYQPEPGDPVVGSQGLQNKIIPAPVPVAVPSGSSGAAQGQIQVK